MNSKTLIAAVALMMLAVCVSTVAFDGSDADASVATETELNTAISNAGTTPTTITITEDISLTSAIRIDSGKTITLDLNGKKLSVSSGRAIQNYGTLTIQGDGTIEGTGTANGPIKNWPTGNLTIFNGTFVGVDTSNSAAIMNQGKMTIETATINGGSHAVYTASDTSTSTVAETTIKGGNYHTQVDNKACIMNESITTINGGTFSNSVFTVVENEGTLTINNATIDNAYRAVVNVAGATATIVNGSFQNSSYKTIGNEGTLTISGGTFSSTKYAAIDNSGTLNLNGGTISSKGCAQCDPNNYQYAVISTAGKVTVTDANITGVHGAMSVRGGSATISGGTFSTVACSTHGDTAAYYPLYMNGNAATDVDISEGTFTGASRSAVYVNASDDRNSIDLDVSGGTFSITSPIEGFTALYSTGASNSTVDVTGGTFSTPLPDTVTVPTGSLEGVNSKGETVVAQAVQVTVDTDGTSKSVSVAKGTCLPVSELPTEQAGLTYTYTLDGTATTRDALLKTDLNGGESIAITSSAVPTDHTITFYIDGTLYATKTVEDGETLTDFPADPTKAGYDFDGWEVSGQPAVFTNVTSDFSVDAAFTLKAPSKVTVELSGPLYEGGSVTATVTAEHELEGVTFLYAISEIGVSESYFGESPTFTIDHAGEYAFGVAAVNGEDVSEPVGSGTIEVTYSTQPSPGYDDDEDLPPFVPGQTQGSDDDSVTIVACAAAAVVAALVAVFLIVSYRKD